MKKVVIIMLLTVILTGCNTKNQTPKENSNKAVNYKEILKANNYLIIDVRTQEEYNESHIKDAINIPYNEINANSNIPKDKDILVYCRSGVRSAKAYEILKQLNYNVYDLGAFDSIDLEKE